MEQEERQRRAQEIVQKLWNRIQAGDFTMLDEEDADVTELVRTLDLPERPATPMHVPVPGIEQSVGIILDALNGEYTVRPEPTVEIPVRRGKITVGEDDPLAEADRAIKAFDDLQF